MNSQTQNIETGCMIKHRLTGAILKVTKIGKPTLYTYVVDCGNSTFVHLNDKVKTSVNAIGITYDVILKPSTMTH